MKSLFFTIYIFLGIFTLYQGSKFVDSLIVGKISQLPTDNITNQKPDKNEKAASFLDSEYDSYISLTPLFQPPIDTKGAIPPGEEEGTTNSPLLNQYQLTGIIYLGKGRSIVLIKKRGEMDSKVYHINDMLGQATIVRIMPDKVYLNEIGKTVILPMYYRNKNNVPSREITSNTNYTPSDNYQTSKKIRKILSRSEVENKVFKKVNQILTQIAVSPYMKNGKMEGLRLVRVPRNNIVYELGGRSGDIIKRVNGHELSQIDQMYKLWDNIKDDSIVSVDLERNNQIYTYTFEIRQ